MNTKLSIVIAIFCVSWSLNAAPDADSKIISENNKNVSVTVNVPETSKLPDIVAKSKKKTAEAATRLKQISLNAKADGKSDAALLNAKIELIEARRAEENAAIEAARAANSQKVFLVEMQDDLAKATTDEARQGLIIDFMFANKNYK